MRDLLDPHWGSILDRTDIDLPQHSLAIEAHAIDGAVTTHCRSTAPA